MNANVTIDPNQVAELGMFHAEREAAQDLEAVMETLSADPKYLYPSLGKGFSGRENAERFYRWFFENFSSKVSTLRSFLSCFLNLGRLTKVKLIRSRLCSPVFLSKVF